MRLNPLQRLRTARDSIAASGLFDAELYRRTYLRRNVLKRRPLLHYLLFGERAGLRPNAFFDPRYYRQQLAAAGLRPEWSALGYYAAQDEAQSLAPSPEFHTAWYAWQNPDWDHGGAYLHPLAHFLHVGLQQLRDPSPFVDLRRHLSEFGPEATSAPAAAVLGEVRRRGRLEGTGITADFEELRARQAAFRAGLNYDVIRRSRPSRPNLVFLQSGRDARPPYVVPERRFDVLRNYYDDPGAHVCGESDHVFFQRGTKATGIGAILRRAPELLLSYDHVLFLDDDIALGAEDIARFFQVMEQRGIALAQPLLTPDSDCVWPVFKDARNAARIVPVSSVEIMMPAFSRDALCRLAWTFGETISGFGADLLWGQTLAAEREAGRIALIGDVLARHEKAIDEVGGAFYAFLAANGVNPKLELWMLMSERGVVPEFRTLEAIPQTAD